MHSAVEYCDNSVIAQMGTPDMRTCIQYAITYPKREVSLSKPLDFASIGQLTFEEPNMQIFTLLSLAYYSVSEDGVLPSVLNASDEVAVDYFLKGKIGFTDIFNVVEAVVRSYKNIKNPTLDEIINADKEARIITLEHINKLI
jgi:1-deoxy-D-xylulose-5-phosphate reductoisomerase